MTFAAELPLKKKDMHSYSEACPSYLIVIWSRLVNYLKLDDSSVTVFPIQHSWLT